MWSQTPTKPKPALSQALATVTRSSTVAVSSQSSRRVRVSVWIGSCIPYMTVPSGTIDIEPPVGLSGFRKAEGGVVEHGCPIGAAVGGGPRPAALEEAHGLVGVAEHAPLVGERHLHHLPPAVDLTDAPVIGDPHIGVEGDVGAVAAQRPDRLHLHT